jgi:hypothetical protein
LTYSFRFLLEFIAMSDQRAFRSFPASARHCRLFRQACKWLEAHLEDSDVRVFETPRDTPTQHVYTFYSPGLWVDVMWIPARDMSLDVFPISRTGQHPARWRYYITSKKQLKAAVASFTAQRQTADWANIKDLPAMLLLDRMLRLMLTSKRLQKKASHILPRKQPVRHDIPPSDKVVLFPVRK